MSRPKWPILDLAKVADTVLGLKNQFAKPAGRALNDVRELLTNGLTFGDNMFAAVIDVELVHGAPQVFTSSLPGRSRPKGFLPIAAFDETGTAIPTPVVHFNATPADRQPYEYSLTAFYRGDPGEVIEGTLARGSANALATNTAEAIVSIDLTPGTWQMSCLCGFTGAPTGTIIAAAINTTPDFTGADQGDRRAHSPTMPTAVSDLQLVVPPVFVSVSALDTWHMVALATFSAGAVSAYGTIRALRTEIDPATTGIVRGILVGG